MEISKLKGMLYGASDEIYNNIERLNSLNVFPIPDGDTGTNMNHTMDGIVQVLVKIGDRELTEQDFDDLYNGVLMASQGNSGVILSQWFKGFFGSLKYAEELSIETLFEAFENGTQTAYNSVSNPVEGTFLTVCREATEYAEEELSEEMTVEDFIECLLTGAKESLERTPDLLPVLKEAGVVDSGAMGFVFLLSGMLKACSTDFEIDLDKYTQDVNNQNQSSQKEDSFGYCTELIIDLKSDLREETAVDYLNTIGNSVVSVKDGNILKIHVHTQTPENVLTFFHKYGEFIKIKIENMNVQHEEMIAIEKNNYDIIAIADGSGIAEVFKNTGAKFVIDGGQSDNISVGEILDCVNSSDCNEIIILPNNKNIFMVAQQAQSNSNKSIHIVNSNSMAEGYSALSVASKDESVNKTLSKMKEAVLNTTTVTIALANKSATMGGLKISVGDYIGMVNDKIVTSNRDVETTIASLLDKIPQVYNIRTFDIFLGKTQPIPKTSKIEKIINTSIPNVEINFINGGQEIYNYVFCIR